jgi:hypothetical protein
MDGIVPRYRVPIFAIGMESVPIWCEFNLLIESISSKQHQDKSWPPMESMF